jgi:mRNA interferase MazF
VWTVHDGLYASKARPAVIAQSNPDDFGSVVVCLFTSVDRLDATCVVVEPDSAHGLAKTSRIMVEKVAATPVNGLGQKIGILTDEQMRAVSRSLAGLLGITGDDLA